MLAPAGVSVSLQLIFVLLAFTAKGARAVTIDTVPVGNLTNAGAYFDSDSPYGTFDQGGNLWEWNETLTGSFRVLRGGAFGTGSESLFSSLWATQRTGHVVGFRVATVPEPSTLTLAAFGTLSLLAYGWRSRKADSRCLVVYATLQRNVVNTKSNL